ncbi:Integrase catalytic domain-containing protein [Abeliophyllum distichum]|uniref:Integrase catalytic domain-containing protein n=1 Tax=Abeliophyllum distichum TaxID=126358 RepID=A0ABD1U0I2_9LAMI
MDHINIYKTKLQSNSPAVKCRNFYTILTSDVKRWYNKLKLGSIRNWPQLKWEFIKAFIGNQTMITDISQLYDIWQKEGESVKSYLKRFSIVINKIESVTNDKALDALVNGHRLKFSQITFIEEDEVGVHYPYCDALVVRTVIARNWLGRMLVDDDSAVNILFGSTFDQMDVDHKLTGISEPLFSFTVDSFIPQGKLSSH